APPARQDRGHAVCRERAALRGGSSLAGAGRPRPRLLSTQMLMNSTRKRSNVSKTAIAVFVVPIVVSLISVLLTTGVLFAINAYLPTQHLMLGYLLPTIFIAIYFGSTIAVLTAAA